MKLKRNNLTHQLLSSQDPQIPSSLKYTHPVLINYDHIIQKQSQIIQNLYKQCTALRQKINKLDTQLIFSSQKQSIPQNNIEKYSEMIEISLLKEIATILEIQQKQISKNKVIQSIKKLKWERQKKSQPIFIETKKEVRIPVPVEIIVEKPVQKIVIRQKIVIQEKIVQVPVFREKIVQTFISKVQDNNLLSTISQVSSEGKKQEKQSGIYKSVENYFLGTRSMKKENKQKVTDEGTKIEQARNEDKYGQYRSQKRGYRNFGMDKNLALNDVRQFYPTSNKPTYYQKDEQIVRQLKSNRSKHNIKSPRYTNNEQLENKKSEYTSKEDNYRYQQRNGYNYDDERQRKEYYRSPSGNNMNSPRNYHQKYRNQEDKYYDQRRLTDQSKGYSKNIKKKEKSNFIERYND